MILLTTYLSFDTSLCVRAHFFSYLPTPYQWLCRRLSVCLYALYNLYVSVSLSDVYSRNLSSHIACLWPKNSSKSSLRGSMLYLLEVRRLSLIQGLDQNSSSWYGRLSLLWNRLPLRGQNRNRISKSADLCAHNTDVFSPPMSRRSQQGPSIGSSGRIVVWTYPDFCSRGRWSSSLRYHHRYRADRGEVGWRSLPNQWFWSISLQ